MRKFHVYQVVSEWVVEIGEDEGVPDEDFRGLAMYLVEVEMPHERFLASGGGYWHARHNPPVKKPVPSCRLIVVEPATQTESKEAT